MEINRANVLQELDRFVEAELAYRRARALLLQETAASERTREDVAEHLPQQSVQQVALVDLNLDC